MFKSLRIEILPGSALIAILGAIVSNSQAAENSPLTREQAPRFIEEGQRITVLQGSRLHSELTIAVVQAKEIQRTLEVPGVVQADPARTVEILSPVTGRLVELKVEPGYRVAQNQELAVIYIDEMRPRAPAIPRLGDQPRSDYETRLDEVSEGRSANRQRAVADPKQPAARQQAISVPLEIARGAPLVSLRAPAAGSLIDLRIGAAAVVTTSNPIMTIANLETIWVTTSVPKKDTALALMGEPVQIRFSAYPGEVFTGEAGLIDSALDANAPDTKIRVAVGNRDIRLKLNMLGDVTFFGPRETVPIVPISAFVSTNNNNMDWVFVEIGPGIFETRAVRIGPRERNQAVVTSGLKVGERVITVGGALLLEPKAQ